MTIADELASDADNTLDPALTRAIASLREPVAVRADALLAVKAATRLIPAASLPVKRAWLTAPRALSASPLSLMAAALLLIAVGAAVPAMLGRNTATASRLSPMIAQNPNAALAQAVRFTVAAPGAQRVSLVGDFNEWNPGATALRDSSGTWTVVIPVAPGRHQYGFVIDGSRWIPDPAAPQSADADFGSPNSVVYVGS
jgi:Carbohydrate-binding module 48 (Isoamylase N-terminal domain)